MTTKIWTRRKTTLTLLTISLGAAGMLWWLFSSPALIAPPVRRPPPPHYELFTREWMDTRACLQRVEVRDEQIIQIIQDTCEYPSLWTIAWLHRYVERAQEPPRDRCARMVIGSGCLCLDGIDLRVSYDPLTGVPQEILRRQAWSPNWQSTEFWRYVLTQREWPDCSLPIPDLGRRVVVVAVKPLP